MVSKQIKSWRQLYLNLNMYAQVNEASWALIREAQCPLRLGICVQLGRGVWLAMRMCHDHWWYAARIDVAVCLLALFHPLLLLTLLACPGYVCRARWLTVLCQFVIAPYISNLPFCFVYNGGSVKSLFCFENPMGCCRKYTLTRSLGPLRGPTSSLRPFGPAWLCISRPSGAQALWPTQRCNDWIVR